MAILLAIVLVMVLVLAGGRGRGRQLDGLREAAVRVSACVRALARPNPCSTARVQECKDILSAAVATAELKHQALVASEEELRVITAQAAVSSAAPHRSQRCAGGRSLG